MATRPLISLLMLVTLLASSTDARASDQVQRLLDEADALRSSNPAAFINTLRRIETFSEEADERQLQHLALLRAYREGFSGRYSEAIGLATRLLEDTQDTELRLRASLLIANSAAAARDFTLSLQRLNDALKMASAPDIDAKLKRQVHAVASIVYNQFGQYSLGEQHANALFNDPGVPRQRCVAGQLQLEAALGLDRWPSDPGTAQRAIEDCEAQDELAFATVIRSYLAKHLAKSGSGAEAAHLLRTHLADAEATRYPRLIAEFHSLLAQFEHEAGNTALATRHAQETLRVTRSNAFSQPRVVAYKVLYETALSRGSPAEALDNYRLYAEADKAHLDDVKARELAFHQVSNEVQQKDQAIALLSKQNEVLKLEQQVARTSAQNTRLLLLLLGVVLAGIGYWAYKIKRVQMAFRRQAQTDGLTGISNRRHFRDASEALLKRCGESGREAALVLLDLNNFKLINDQHGHAAGDWVLRQVAEACKAVCRDGDLCGRLGGEEFGILSCGGDADAARRIAEQCRERLAAIDASQVGHDQRITASFGCTTSRRSGYAFETMFSDADTAMYRAKGSGRDRIVIHAADASPAPAPTSNGRLETSTG